MNSRYALITLLSCATILLFSPTTVRAQYAPQGISPLTATPGVSMPAEQGQIHIGVGLAYNSHVEDPGIGAGIWYQISEMISAGAQFTYFLIESREGASESIYTIDVMGAYPLMESESGLVLSAIAGLNALFYSFSIDNCDSGGIFGDICDESFSDVGLNAGGMVLYPLGSLSVFGQLFVVGLGGESSGVQLGGGVAFGL